MRVLLCLFALLVLPATAALAQLGTTTYNPNDPTVANPGQPNRERDAFGSGGGGFSMMDLIHRANLGSSQTPDEFKRSSGNKIDEAVTNFRRTELRVTPKMLNSGDSAAPEAAPAARP